MIEIWVLDGAIQQEKVNAGWEYLSSVFSFVSEHIFDSVETFSVLCRS